MTTTRTALVGVGALAVFLAASPAQALSIDQYLKLRRQSGYDPRLTYAQVQSGPSGYLNRVLEMRGSVSGTIRRDQTISFLLTMADKSSVFLTAPPADANMVSDVNHQMLRVLARVSTGTAGNVVPLDVLGIAYDAEVTQREREAAQREQAAYGGRRYARRSSDRPMNDLASRGYRTRRISGGGELSALAARTLSPEAQAIYPAYKEYIYRCNKRLSAQELDEITVSLLYFSQRHRIDPRLVVAMIIAESDFDPRSTSHKGAMGLGQIMPDEARDHQLTNPYDPIQNVRASVNLLKQKLNLYSDGSQTNGQLTVRQVMLALAAYNAGAGAVKKYGGVPPYRETQGYIKRILKIYADLCRED